MNTVGARYSGMGVVLSSSYFETEGSALDVAFAIVALREANTRSYRTVVLRQAARLSSQQHVVMVRRCRISQSIVE